MAGGTAGTAGAAADGWVPRTFVLPTTTEPASLSVSTTPDATLTVTATEKLANVLPTQFGVNTTFRSGATLIDRAQTYQQGRFGVYRFPAGSGSDSYFWDGKVPSSLAIPVSSINGLQAGVLTPELFAKFLGAQGAQATVVVNYGFARYGTTPEGTRAARVLQAAEYAAGFVRRMNVELKAGVRYWEIGNETYGNWEVGHDVNGSVVNGQEYGEDLRVFAQAMKAVDPTILVGAVLHPDDDAWNGGVLPQVKDSADFLVIHEYFVPEKTASSASVLASVPTIQHDVDDINAAVVKHTGSPSGRYPIALTEFNSRGYPATNMANGLFVSQLLGEVVKSKLTVASLWVNEWASGSGTTSHGMLTTDDPGQPAYSPRPSYMPFYFYGKYFGDTLLKTAITGTGLNAYASSFASGSLGLVLVNTGATDQQVKLSVGTPQYTKAYWHNLSADNLDAGNKKFYINGRSGSTPGGGPSDYANIPAYAAPFANDAVFTAKKFSVSYLALVR